MTSQHEKAKRWQFSLRGLLGAFILIGFIALAFRVCYMAIGPAMPVDLMRQIKEGMPKSEVLRILGEPYSKGERVWMFRRPGNVGYVQIYFDDNGSVRELNDESALGHSH